MWQRMLQGGGDGGEPPFNGIIYELGNIEENLVYQPPNTDVFNFDGTAIYTALYYGNDTSNGVLYFGDNSTSAYGYGGYTTEEYFDLSKFRTLKITIDELTSSASSNKNEALGIALIDEQGTKKELLYLANPKGYTGLKTFDISQTIEPNKKYRLCFGLCVGDSYSYTGVCKISKIWFR